MSNRVVKDMKTTIEITDESVTCKDQNGNERWQANLICGGDIEIIDKRTQQPTERELALAGKWEPDFTTKYATKRNALYYCSDDETDIQFVNFSDYRMNFYRIKDRPEFFPTRELAEEYQQVIEGTWLPKKGDKFIAFNKRSLDSDNYYGHEAYTDFSNTNMNDYFFPASLDYAPILAKLKPKPPLDELTVEGLRIDWDTDKLHGKMGIGILDTLSYKAYTFLRALYYHDRIREAEGRDKPTPFFYTTNGATREAVLDMYQFAVGGFYFATEKGRDLFLSALGDSVSELRLG